MSAGRYDAVVVGSGPNPQSPSRAPGGGVHGMGGYYAALAALGSSAADP